MKRKNIGFTGLAALALAACSGSTAGKCTPGASAACNCTDGRSGAQICQADGTFASCACSSAGTGSSSGGATGSATGSSGTAAGSSTGTGSSSGGGSSTGAASSTGSGTGSSGSSAGSSTGGSGSTGSCSTGTFDFLSPPGQIPVPGGLQSASSVLVATSSGYLMVTQAGATDATLSKVTATPFAADGTPGTQQTFSLPYQNSSVAAATACGGVVVAGANSLSGSTQAFFAALHADGSLNGTVQSLTYSRGAWPRVAARADGSGTEAVVTLGDHVSFLGCDGSVSATVPLATLMGSVACPSGSTCNVSWCAISSADEIACAIESSPVGSSPTDRWVVSLDATGAVKSGPHDILGGIQGGIGGLWSCGPGCFSLLLATGSGGYLAPLDGTGAPTASPRPLATSHGFAQAEVTLGSDFVAILTPSDPTMFTLYPTDIFVFDPVTFAPLVADSLGRATPLPLPADKLSSGCSGGSAVLAMAPASGTGRRLALDFVTVGGWGDASCTSKPSLIFLGCK